MFRPTQQYVLISESLISESLISDMRLITRKYGTRLPYLLKWEAVLVGGIYPPPTPTSHVTSITFVYLPSNRYRIAGSFCMIQNFAVFTDRPATMKRKHYCAKPSARCTSYSCMLRV